MKWDFRSAVTWIKQFSLRCSERGWTWDTFSWKPTQSITRPPWLKNWYPKIDVRLIRKGNRTQTAKARAAVYTVKPWYHFYGHYWFPFPWNEDGRDVIKMYEPTTQFKENILLDRKNATSEIYYIPLLEHCDCLAPESELSRGRDTLITAVLDPEKLRTGVFLFRRIF